MCKQPMRLLFNTRNWNFVLDGKLTTSRVKDVDCRTLSTRKTDKEGPVVNCLADSLFGILYVIRLKVSCESQKDHVIELMKTVPPITQAGHHPGVALNRGYINRKLIADPTVAQFESVLVSATMLLVALTSPKREWRIKRRNGKLARRCKSQ